MELKTSDMAISILYDCLLSGMGEFVDVDTFLKETYVNTPEVFIKAGMALDILDNEGMTCADSGHCGDHKVSVCRSARISASGIVQTEEYSREQTREQLVRRHTMSVNTVIVAGDNNGSVIGMQKDWSPE